MVLRNACEGSKNDFETMNGYWHIWQGEDKQHMDEYKRGYEAGNYSARRGLSPVAPSDRKVLFKVGYVEGYAFELANAAIV
jgi:hypothetical protein